jgi:ABC-type multidrug transport system fused ATPase/permease subunit
MVDLDDIIEEAFEDSFEGLFEIEDIVEEIFDPEELIEDLVENTIKVILAIVASIALVITLILVLIGSLLLLLTGSFAEVIILISFVTLLVTVFSVVGFLYVRTDLPDHIEKKVNNALEEADSEPDSTGMTQEDAIDELKHKYVNDEIDEYELDRAIDDVLNSNDNKEVLKEYN